jgi:hypothetical protein
MPAKTRRAIGQIYIDWAQKLIRHPNDVHSLTHLLLYLATCILSAALLFNHFSWLQAVIHWQMQLSYTGPFTLIHHYQIRHQGFLAEKYASLEQLSMFFFQPIMGYTWHPYYYHHLKHLPLENNSPENFSLTSAYQGVAISNLVLSLIRSLLLVWIELPLHFLRSHRPILALKSLFWELSSYLLVALLAQCSFLPTLFVLILPFLQMRVGMTLCNRGQHSVTNDEDESSALESAISVRDVQVRPDSHRFLSDSLR